MGLSWGLSWLHVGRLLEPKLKPKLDLSWGLSWPHVGGLGASWGVLGHSSAILGRSEGNAFTCQSELAAREAGGERASVEESTRICFQHVHDKCFQQLLSDCLHDARDVSAARLVRMLVVCLLF